LARLDLCRWKAQPRPSVYSSPCKERVPGVKRR
jgi:hypothetical protein